MRTPILVLGALSALLVVPNAFAHRRDAAPGERGRRQLQPRPDDSSRRTITPHPLALRTIVSAGRTLRSDRPHRPAQRRGRGDRRQLHGKPARTLGRHQADLQRRHSASLHRQVAGRAAPQPAGAARPWCRGGRHPVGRARRLPLPCRQARREAAGLEPSAPSSASSDLPQPTSP